MALQFTFDQGEWVREQDTLRQTMLDTGSRCHVKAGQDFVIDVGIKIEESMRKEDHLVGEAKIIFTDADENESYRIDFMSGTNWCRVTLSNSMAIVTPLRITVGEEFPVRVVVRNNFLSVKVSGMEIVRDYQFGTKSDGNVGFGTYCAKATFSKIKITELIRKKCFIVMPFDEKGNFLYEYAIEPALMEHPIYDFEYIRADKLLTVEKIIDEITDHIEKADLLIVDISKENTNVYYELGFGHAFKKKAILLRQSLPESPPVPFNIRLRYHPYEFSPDGFRKLKSKLTEIITNVLSN